ncbi:dienelactone hydrolase family protein [Cohnella sp. AR92]|uniref:dienelactone hydrolase family protein n=1 Tax=Cohnella sp. AR92 TaxID=648716 RepID=UPI000F8DD030|nr:alpha/beta hydrolase family protein [Cohnella sp. AR92]RUS41935.1 dienelactone hydrolase [Cohnella sp. AR92]
MRRGDDFLEALYEETADNRKVRQEAETISEHRGRLIRELRESLGEFRLVEQRSVKLLERVEFEDYIRERVELSIVDGLAFASYVLLPKGKTGKLPAVLAVHGHGYGSRQICGLNPDGTPDTGESDGYRHFALQLVDKGMAVIAPDVIGFGERMLQVDLNANPPPSNSCYRLATQLLMAGKTLTGLRVAELCGAFDYLAGRVEVDAERIGIVGFSGGALLSYVAAALEERIRAAVLIGFPNTFKDSIIAVHHCICNYTPGILQTAELPELIGLLAPRPLFLESGDRDPIFPAHGFEKAVRELRRLYRSEGAEDHLAYDLFPGVHEVNGRRSFEWLREML